MIWLTSFREPQRVGAERLLNNGHHFGRRVVGPRFLRNVAILALQAGCGRDAREISGSSFHGDVPKGLEATEKANSFGDAMTAHFASKGSTGMGAVPGTHPQATRLATSAIAGPCLRAFGNGIAGSRSHREIAEPGVSLA